MTTQLSPIEQFRQLKSALVSGKEHLIIGIDIGKKKSVACITDNNKRCYVKKFAFSNTLEGITAFMKKALEIQNQTKISDIVYGLEPTGNYHKPIASFLISKGFNVVGISTVGAKQNRKSLDGRWRKNDPKDAYNITDMISQGKMFFYREDAETENIKALLKLTQRLTKKLSSHKVRLRNNHFSNFFPEIEPLYTDILHREVIQILKYFPTAYDIRQTSFAKFSKKLKSKHPTAQKKSRIYKIWQLAETSIGRKPFESTYMEIEFILEEVQYLRHQLFICNRKINALCSDDKDCYLLQTIPGVGPITSAIVISQIGNIDNYQHSKQLTKLSGLDLEYAQSGKYYSRAMISKKGSSLLRYALTEAVIRILQHNNKIKEVFDHKLEIKGNCSESKAKLRIKLAEKLLRAAYTMLKTKQPFDIDKFINPVESNLNLTT